MAGVQPTGMQKRRGTAGKGRTEEEDNASDWGRKRVMEKDAGRGWKLQPGFFQLSATVWPQSKNEPLVSDGDRLGSQRYIDSQVHSFGRIRIDGTCPRPRFIYLFIQRLLWPWPYLSEYTRLPAGATAARCVQTWQLIGVCVWVRVISKHQQTTFTVCTLHKSRPIGQHKLTAHTEGRSLIWLILGGFFSLYRCILRLDWHTCLPSGGEQ